MLKFAVTTTSLVAIGLMTCNVSYADCELTPYERYMQAEYHEEMLNNLKETNKWMKKEWKRHHNNGRWHKHHNRGRWND